MEKTDVLIVGAGLSGLTAAKILKATGRSVKVIEASDDIGGRVRTDYIEGFQLDRGFQVLLTAYPEAKKILDYKSLHLHFFEPGAVILNENGFTTVSDPLRNPSKLWKTLFSSAGSMKDKLLMLKLKQQLKRKSIDKIFAESSLTTLEYLKNYGFSENMIGNFFKPFFGGVFLENELETPDNMFEFLFKMFSNGRTAVPALGMGMIAKQLGNSLEKKKEIILNERAIELSDGRVLTNKGQTYEANYVLLATDESSIPGSKTRNSVTGRQVSNIYFIADKKPVSSGMVLLNASKNKLVNNVVVLDNISPYYAPKGKSLISVSVLGDFRERSPDFLERQTMHELRTWFLGAKDWRYLKTYHIHYALPRKQVYKDNLTPCEIRDSDRIFRCGDYLLNGSINGAIKSGRLAAEAILSL